MENIFTYKLRATFSGTLDSKKRLNQGEKLKNMYISFMEGIFHRVILFQMSSWLNRKCQKENAWQWKTKATLKNKLGLARLQQWTTHRFHNL